MGDYKNSRTGASCGMCRDNGRLNYNKNRTYQTERSERPYGGSCGCKSHGNARMNTANRSARSEESNSCCEEMETLRKIEFAIVDVALYLNAYPESECALAYYHKLIEERKCLLQKIHETCGPTTLYDNVSETCWKWIEGPWPWQYGAN